MTRQKPQRKTSRLLQSRTEGHRSTPKLIGHRTFDKHSKAYPRLQEETLDDVIKNDSEKISLTLSSDSEKDIFMI